jgi:hypothetical protein
MDESTLNSLKARRQLLEKDIEIVKKEAAQLYLKYVTNMFDIVDSDYVWTINRLSELQTELNLVNSFLS